MNDRSNQDIARWQHRLASFGKALRQLEAACDKTSYTDLERAGLVQMFEFTFELCWKTLKDRLTYDGVTVTTPRETIRNTFSVAYISESEAETLLEALEKRNLLSHTYEEHIAQAAERLIKTRFAPVLSAVYNKISKAAAHE